MFVQFQIQRTTVDGSKISIVRSSRDLGNASLTFRTDASKTKTLKISLISEGARMMESLWLICYTAFAVFLL